MPYVVLKQFRQRRLWEAGDIFPNRHVGENRRLIRKGYLEYRPETEEEAATPKSSRQAKIEREEGKRAEREKAKAAAAAEKAEAKTKKKPRAKLFGRRPKTKKADSSKPT